MKLPQPPLPTFARTFRIHSNDKSKTTQTKIAPNPDLFMRSYYCAEDALSMPCTCLAHALHMPCICLAYALHMPCIHESDTKLLKYQELMTLRPSSDLYRKAWQRYPGWHLHPNAGGEHRIPLVFATQCYSVQRATRKHHRKPLEASLLATEPVLMLSTLSAAQGNRGKTGLIHLKNGFNARSTGSFSWFVVCGFRACFEETYCTLSHSASGSRTSPLMFWLMTPAGRICWHNYLDVYMRCTCR